MRIRYVGPASEGVVLSPSGVELPYGVPVDVDDVVALALLEQDVFQAAVAAPIVEEVDG